MSPPPDIRISNILHPTDFSDLSVHALHYAAHLAGRLQARLHCLHVVDDSYQYWLAADIAAMPIGPPIEEVMTSSKDQLAAFIERHLGPGIDCDKVIRRGRAFLEIINYAKEASVDMIVMGTHGRTALSQMLMGSVADKVVRKAPCPVVTVHSPGHQFEMP